ncbi:hypothetical protein NQD34_017602 [Periophthalmus magnuspinnatus]|nr:hypothetical protein NQD34_017602 [Periophthalmus magnuspinnatus]
MFSYIKNLNDMVFSTSDAPEEQPSVLGRIGSWLWSRSSLSSSENASPNSPNRPEGTEQSDSLTDDVFYAVSQDSQKSLHTSEGQPSGEETAEEEWEEARSSFESGNLTSNHQNTKHLSHWEVYGKSDRDHAQDRQARAGKKLHVYLEETSVSGSAGQEVVSTKYAKSLQVRPKAKRSVSLDTEREPSYSSALVGVNLKSPKAENLDGEDDMGRKSARRRYRKNSQGDERSNVTQPDREVTDKADKAVTPSQKARSPKSNVTNHTPAETSPSPSPELQTHSSGLQYLESGQDLNSTLACGGAAVEEEVVNMADNERLYRVERRTETPESKRRSMKVSRSEVKLFPKNVPLRAEHKVVMRREQIQEETAADLRLNDAKKPDDKPKPAPGRIADKISIFENQKLVIPGQFHIPRSADVSPIRKPAGRLKEALALSGSPKVLIEEGLVHHPLHVIEL